MNPRTLLDGSLVLACCSSAALAQPLLVDGVWNEWTDPPAATDPAGDATGVFDLTTVHAVVRGTRVFIAWDTGTDQFNTQAGNGSDGNVIIELDMGAQGLLTIDLRNRVARLDGVPVSWFEIAYETLPTTASERYETTVDLASYVSATQLSFTLNFSGSDSLAAPIALTTNSDELVTPVRNPEQWDCTDLRVASLNTLFGSLQSSDGLGRLLDAVNPDVIALQEENGSLQPVLDRLNEIDPLDNGRTWNGVKVRDTIVASPYTVIQVPGEPFNDHVGAIVDLGFGDAYYIASVHPRCCGAAGDGADQQRVFEMQLVADQIAALRADTLGTGFTVYADAPAIVIGDWNLVGSDAPLEVMLDPNGPAQVDWPLEHLAEPSIVTWRDQDGFGFSPGRLDLVTHDTTLLRRNGYVLDTERIPQTTIKELNLQPGDALDSDHLLLVADFALNAQGDADSSGCVDIEDLYTEDSTDLRGFLRRRELAMLR